MSEEDRTLPPHSSTGTSQSLRGHTINQSRLPIQTQPFSFHQISDSPITSAPQLRSSILGTRLPTPNSSFISSTRHTDTARRLFNSTTNSEATTEAITSASTGTALASTLFNNTVSSNRTTTSQPTTIQVASTGENSDIEPSAPEPTSSTGTLTDHSIVVDIPIPHNTSYSSDSDPEDLELTALKNTFVQSIADKVETQIDLGLREFKTKELDRLRPIFPQTSENLRHHVLHRSVQRQINDLNHKFIHLQNKVANKRRRIDESINESILENTPQDTDLIQRLETEILQANEKTEQVKQDLEQLQKCRVKLQEEIEALKQVHQQEKESIQIETKAFLDQKLAEQHQIIEAEAKAFYENKFQIESANFSEVHKQQVQELITHLKKDAVQQLIEGLAAERNNFCQLLAAKEKEFLEKLHLELVEKQRLDANNVSLEFQLQAFEQALKEKSLEIERFKILSHRPQPSNLNYFPLASHPTFEQLYQNQGRQPFNPNIPPPFIPTNPPPKDIPISNRNKSNPPPIMNTNVVVLPPDSLRKYDGSTSFSAWLTDFENYAAINNYTDAAKKALMPMHLIDAARTAYNIYHNENHSDTSTYTYAQLAQYMKDSFKYKTSPEEYRRQLDQRKLKTTENIETYYFDILTLCKRVNGSMDDLEKVRYLIKGLPFDMAQRIYTAELKTPADVLKKMHECAQLDSLMGVHGSSGFAKHVANIVVDEFKNLSINGNQVNNAQRGKKGKKGNKNKNNGNKAQNNNNGNNQQNNRFRGNNNNYRGRGRRGRGYNGNNNNNRGYRGNGSYNNRGYNNNRGRGYYNGNNYNQNNRGYNNRGYNNRGYNSSRGRGYYSNVNQLAVDQVPCCSHSIHSTPQPHVTYPHSENM